MTIVTPVLKNALNYQELRSYTPISNLFFVSSVPEYGILEQLVSHLEVIETLPNNQSAYRKLFSTEKAICPVVNYMLEMMEENKCGILVLLDLRTAIDTVVRELLLNDLRSIGVEDKAFEYSYSSYEPLNRGVP
ncbi:uncharacterized protein [Palaemon carinicauda]|uniref:uncharacterized protein n=1 Tax=Palaemon carinicauda TaxID=392227 RepID=UPI0035B695E2